MRIAITGAAGRVGREVADDLGADHELTLIDRRPIDDARAITLDLSQSLPPDEPDPLERALQGIDVLVHLAEDPDAFAPWQSVLSNNMTGTWRLTRLAADKGVRRIVYGSSHRAVRALEKRLAPDYRMPDGGKIPPDAPPSPSSYYGIAKVCAELTGKMLVESGELQSFIAVRIGNFAPQAVPSPHQRTFGIMSGDLRCLFRRCVEADFSGFHIVYGVSKQECGPFDLSRAFTLLNWTPTELPP
jgi:NAD+ dependent glucose-6-phosphate dehydrogenase